MGKKNKIVFISHDSSLTGAPILLLNLLQLIKKTDKYDIQIILFRGGILEKKFREIAPVYMLKPADYNQKKSFYKRMIYYLRYRYRRYHCLNNIRDANVVINNTIANGRLLKLINRLKIPIVSYVHELESVIRYFNKKGEAAMTLKYSDLFICPSKTVADNLIANHGIQQNKINYLPYFLKVVDDADSKEIEVYRKKLFTNNKIPDRRFYVAGMGTATHRKGIDLFLEVCKHTIDKDKQICFIWIGDFEDQQMNDFINKEVNRNKLHDFFFITGKQPPAFYNLSPFNLFFLSSREDPYPLVVLEAALLKIPSLCFANSGGIVEFVSPDAGWVIENFDTVKASEKIVELRNHQERMKEYGKNAFEKVKQLHTNETAITDKFAEIINNVLKL